MRKFVRGGVRIGGVPIGGGAGAERLVPITGQDHQFLKVVKQPKVWVDVSVPAVITRCRARLPGRNPVGGNFGDSAGI
jgi:hypothetical protein